MNILSAVAFIDTKKINFITQSIAKIGECEIITTQDSKMIILINSKNELAKFKQIEKIDGVLSLNLTYSYQENICFNERKIANLDDFIHQNSNYCGDLRKFYF